MKTGRVDERGRALISFKVSHPQTGASLTLDAWIDTAFTGGLMLTAPQMAALDLPQSSAVKGYLADGSQIVLVTYTALVDWFSSQHLVEVITGSGPVASLGLTLLVDCTLVIDQPARTVQITSLSEQASPGSGP